MDNRPPRGGNPTNSNDTDTPPGKPTRRKSGARTGARTGTRTGASASTGNPISSGAIESQTEAENLVSGNGSKPGEPTSVLSQSSVHISEPEQPLPDKTPIVDETSLFAFTSPMVVLVLLDGIVSIVLGSECTMTKDEKKMLSEPLERMLKRLPIDIGAKMGQYVDPLLFTMGLIAWGSRIARIKRTENEKLEKRQQARKSEKSPEEPEPTGEPGPGIMAENQDVYSSLSVPDFLIGAIGEPLE